MAHSVIACCVAALVALAAVTSAKMVFVEAGKNGKTGPMLTQNVEFCPSTFSSKGFSIVCTEVEGPVTFFVNGVRIRKERFAPYTLAGDTAAVGIRAYTSYPESGFNINCRSTSGNEYVYVNISCSARTETAPVAESSVVPRTIPRTIPRTVPIPEKSPSKPTPTALPTQAPSPPPMTISVGTMCIKMNGYMNMDLTPGWTVEGTSVWYKKGNSESTTVPAETAKLDYMFVAPKTGNYSLTLDMETAGETTNNDVYVNFRYGLILRRSASATEPKSVIEKTGTDYVRAYHLKNGRAVEAWAVDSDPHAMSTGTPLRAGRMYKLTVGARSTNVKINSIIMFPCEADECTPGSAVWNAGVANCQ